ncbi:MAG: hypothetical protein LBS53_04590 [Synergistaceae bacterium]|jgi:hypothetical protein|nr:hypothetical protein [Synergistaceae bacterium]
MKLRLSEHGTGARGYFSSRTPETARTEDYSKTLWRTPKADDANHGAASETGIIRRIMKHQTIRLQDQVNHPRLFRTPDAGCSRGVQSKQRFAESQEKGRLLTLNDQVTHLFPTPRAADGDKGTRSPDGVTKELSRGHGIDLPSHVQIFPFPTPTIRGNYNRACASSGSGDGLETFVRMYPTSTANDPKNNNLPPQRTENGRHGGQANVTAGGSLNPEWVEWLMGLPVGWTDIG